MKILVTGTAGVVGSVVACELLEHGHSVRALDVMPPREKVREAAQNPAQLETVYCDLSDRMALLKAAEGCDAIAHLAAIANPGQRDDIIMQTNVVGTQYILAAAQANGISRVALASSCCAFGFFYAEHPFDPQGFPLDETHPTAPQDLYALSKVFNEETAAAYTRRYDMTTLCLRLTTVMNFDNQRHLHWRRRQLQHAATSKERDFWSYIELQDAARAFRLAVTEEISGHHTLVIANPDSFLLGDIRDAARQHFPDVPLDENRLSATSCLYDLSRAENVLGFVAQNSWRDVAELREVEANRDDK